MYSTIPILHWIHIVAMLATLGVLLFAHFGLTGRAASDAAIMRSSFKMASGLAILGLVGGLGLFYIRIQLVQQSGGSLAAVGGHLILTKLGIWAIVAGCLMVGSVKAKKNNISAARALRLGSLVLIVAASILGVLV